MSKNESSPTWNILYIERLWWGIGQCNKSRQGCALPIFVKSLWQEQMGLGWCFLWSSLGNAADAVEHQELLLINKGASSAALLGCPSCWSSLTHTQKPAWEWHLAHVEHRGKLRKIAREQPSKFKSLVKEIALLTTHSDASATASDLPQSGIKTGIRGKDVPQCGYKYFFSIAATRNGTSDDAKNSILFFSCFYGSDLSSSKHLYDFTPINIPTRCQIPNSTKH